MATHSSVLAWRIPTEEPGGHSPWRGKELDTTKHSTNTMYKGFGWLRGQRIRLQCGRPGFDPWVRKIYCRRDKLPTPVFLGFPGDSAGKGSACNAGDLGLIPGLGRSPGEGHGNPLQCSCLENPHGQRSLVGYSPWGRKESDTTERLSFSLFIVIKRNEFESVLMRWLNLEPIIQSEECQKDKDKYHILRHIYGI